ncbi:hypothetical protein [Brevundimonas sp. FT23028]|uniref:hypothetical protein n=1 Tax=Brevundimonas sp. FT23028 TaxID=3393748 RepID=UPI003B58A032
MATLAITLLTLAGVLALLRFGDREERIIAGVVLALLVLVRVVDPVQINGWKAGVAGLETAFLIVILWLTCVCDRWWLTALAGFQLISLLTHVVPLLNDGRYLLWTAITIRLEVWVLICITFFVGAWEAWAARRFAREGVSHDQDQHRPGLVGLDPVRRP